MRLLISGYRDYNDEKNIEEQIIKVLNYDSNYKNHTIIHGGCSGVDIISGKIGFKLGLNVEKYPANWKLYGISAGPKRNLEMIKKGRPDFAILFIHKKSKGTVNMRVLLEKYKIPFCQIDI